MHLGLSRLQNCLVSTRAFSTPAFTTASTPAVRVSLTTLAIKLPRQHWIFSNRNEHQRATTVCALNRRRDLSTSNKGRSHSTQCSSMPASMNSSNVGPELPGSLHTATLKDGRTVTYAMCGSRAPDAHTVLFLHPIQGNRWGHTTCAGRTVMQQ